MSLEMRLRLQFDNENIDFNLIAKMLQQAGMANYAPEKHQLAFNNSQTVVFVFDNDNQNDSDLLVGFGRAISDGAYQAAIYDVVVAENYQGKGIGKLIIAYITEKNAHCNMILYASIGKEKFYEKEKFRKMKTGMALFKDIEKMKNKGFTE